MSHERNGYLAARTQRCSRALNRIIRGDFAFGVEGNCKFIEKDLRPKDEYCPQSYVVFWPETSSSGRPKPWHVDSLSPDGGSCLQEAQIVSSQI